MTYRCRFRVPVETDWSEVDAASPEDAAHDFHYDNSASAGDLSITHRGAGVSFALVEVDGHGELVSRVYYHGLSRKGGVRRERPTLHEIARRLGWEHPVEELLEEGWSGEETEREASDRKWARIMGGAS